MRHILLLWAVAVGCGGASVGNGPHDNGGDDSADPTPDAAVATADAAPEVMVDAAPAAACMTGRKIVLVFEGIQVTKSATSDSTAVPVRVAWMSNANVNVPKYHNGVANRAQQITTIVDGIKAALVGTPIEVVTERPAVGPYVMIIFGGTNTTYGTPYLYGTSDHDCGDANKNDVAFVSDTISVELAQDIALGAVGWAIGLNGTNNVNDCMCGWGNTTCANAAGRCTFGTAITTVPSQAPANTCQNPNPQDEVAAFKTFCQ